MSQDRPIRVDGKRLVSLPTAVLITLLGTTATAAIAWNTFKKDLDSTAATVAEHSKRIEAVETKAEDLREMKNDIGWIKKTMEQDRQDRRGR